MRGVRPDAIIGGGLLLFCVVVYLIIPFEIQELRRYDASTGLSPAVLPRLSVFLIAGFSVALILSGLRSKDLAHKEGQRVERTANRARVITTFIILLAYVYLLDILGYLVITPLALGLLMWHFGERHWLRVLATVLLTTTGLFGFFRYIMFIILPEGILLP